LGTSDDTPRFTVSSSRTPAAIRIDSALSTSAKLGTKGQPSLFLPLGFQPSRSDANAAVTSTPALERLEDLTPGQIQATHLPER
jgi:hypothetical protein